MTRTINRTQSSADKQPNSNWGSKGFKKGQSGNPAGRPKTAKCIPDMLRDIGDRPVSDWLLASLHKKYGPDHNPKTMREAMLMAAAFDAAHGDQHAREFIAERTEGKVPQAQVNLNANQDTNDLTKMPLAEILRLANELTNGS